MSLGGAGTFPLTGPQIAARLAALDPVTLAAVMAAVASPNTTPGIAAFLTPTLQGTREALQIGFPSAQDRFFRNLMTS